MRDSAGEVLYVGKAKDLQKRVSQYFDPSRASFDSKNQHLLPLIRKVDYIPCASEREALLLEAQLIKERQPVFNVLLKDSKSYPWVKLTLNEDFPRIFLTRKKAGDGALYFGPYPKVAQVRGLLTHLWRRKLFPLRPCRWDFSVHKPLATRKIHSCLYYHTRECPAPCAGRIQPKAYRRIAKDAALFFKGRYRALTSSFTREMGLASRAMEYERAARLRDNLRALKHMGERVQFERIRPDRLESRLKASESVTDLQQALGLARPPFHIEAFDISNLSGRHAVGSMVCFQGGCPHKDHYRRFRIRSVRGIDDFAMMKEVVFRRYRRLKSSGPAHLPDLVLLDGGKGQLGAAARALEALKVPVPLAALAKREEEIHLPGSLRPLVLERDRPALRLLQHLRDEAHRFAVTYHRLLRKKALLR